MIGTAENSQAPAADPYAVDRHSGDVAPGYSGDSAADSMARGAADTMWRKVEEDLEKIDRVDSEDAGDD